MTTREALSALAARGLPITQWRLRNLITKARIPKPRLDSSLSWDWSEADLAAVERAIKNKAAAEASHAA